MEMVGYEQPVGVFMLRNGVAVLRGELYPAELARLFELGAAADGTEHGFLPLA